ncbi:hypothetical protein QGM61_13970 [Pseudohongiella sp. SYSU M77423]|uniref:hypothetical protein n=1 Tax=Pseudohongiella sp. SYSU M77423 TaxID=3042312 RepID=UPI002480D4B7|nr:hypothetical protein [Pseudohongiella sp. SYSU M77423]MDH7944931.1 hypothetical protein [Pseudohongiella sp. SYSU M77423]
MDALVFGAGTIYREFYRPILKSLGFRQHLVDPRLDSHSELPSRDYDVVLVLSPPQAHFENFQFLYEQKIKWKRLIVEKPALVTRQQFLKTVGLFAHKKKSDICTVSPRRLSLAFSFLRANALLVKSIELKYGIQSKWTQMSASDAKYNSCVYDLGTHFFDAVQFALSNCVSGSAVVEYSKLSFNAFKVRYTIGSCNVSISVSRASYYVNYLSITYVDGAKSILPLDLNDTVFSTGQPFMPKLDTTNAISEFLKFLNGEDSLLFSPMDQFYPIIELLDSVND